MKKKITIPILIIIVGIFLSLFIFQEDDKGLQRIALLKSELVNDKREIEFDIEKVDVKRVFDGDTFQTEAGENVRLIGIDTPEMNWENGEPDIFARESLKYTQEKVLNKTVYLIYDREKEDKYGRKLAYVITEEGIFLNQKLLQKGYASLMLVPPNTTCSHIFKSCVLNARKDLQGVWGEWYNLSQSRLEVSWQDADKYLGQEVTVKGKIVETAIDGKVNFLRFTREDEKALQLVIFEKDLRKFAFDPVKDLKGRDVIVTGRVERYQDILEIIVDTPYQLYLLEQISE